MKLTPHIIKVLEVMAANPNSELRGTSLTTEDPKLLFFHASVVKAAHVRGLIDHVSDYRWGATYDDDGNIVEEFVKPVYRLSEAGRKALQDLK